MRKKGTFKDLMLILDDIEQQSKDHITFALFNRDKINHFHEANKGRIDEFRERVNAMTMDHGKIDEAGNLMMTAIEGKPAALFKSAEDKSAFQNRYWQLLGEEIHLTL